MLTAAVERDRLAGELAALNVQLRAAPVRESVDPKSEAIAKAFAFVGLAVAPRDVALALTLLIALVAELLTVGGPAWCGARLPSREPADRTRTVEAAKASDSAPEPVAPASTPQVEPVAALPGFLAGLVKCASTR